MGTKSRLRISQCMIVKNEEANIEKALSWGKDLMWEQIVVDTGSLDRTVEIAKAKGAKVFSFPWIDDFAAAKNYAIGQAKGDWIAFLDADEYMIPEDAKSLYTAIAGLPKDSFDGISTGWQQINEEGKITSSGTQIRFFRNRPDLRYRRRIHEQLFSTTGRELHLGDVTRDLSIFHTGYQTKALTGGEKNTRNQRLILKELEDHPEDYEMMGYMGDECLGDGKVKEAKDWYVKAIEHMPQKLVEYDQRSAVTFTRLLILLTQETEDSWEKAQKVYEKAVSMIPEEADFYYIAGCFWVNQGNAKKAVCYLEAAVEKLNTYGCNNRALLLAGNLLEAYESLVRCCYEMGDLKKCVAFGVNYLKYQPYGMAVLVLLLKAVLSDGKQNAGQEEYEAVLEFLFKIYDASSLKDRLFVVKTAQMAEYEGLAGYMAGRLLTPAQREKMGFSW